MGWRSLLSDNPDKAWGEALFLAYSPTWIVAVAVVMLTGVLDGWGDAAYLTFGIATIVPAVVIPPFLRQPTSNAKPGYWLKFHVWIAIVVFSGTYFVTHFFFGYMGMRYAFPTRWVLSSELMARGDQSVPLFLYPLTHAYFLTYFTVLVIVLRAVRRRFEPGSQWGWLGTAVAVVVLSYALAWLETFVMASKPLAAVFSYADRSRMLSWGSVGYGLLYVVALPMVYRMDERANEWSMGRTIVEACATSFVIVVVLDVWATVVGPI